MLIWISKFPSCKKAFCFTIWKQWSPEKLHLMFPSNCRNKKLWCYDWWTKNDQPVKTDLRPYDNVWKIGTI